MRSVLNVEICWTVRKTKAYKAIYKLRHGQNNK